MTQTDVAPVADVPAAKARLRHVPALDGLRGAAVVAVVAFHAGHLTGGYLGVDLFFVLSGYLITSLLLVERSATGRISVRDFYARRFRRLLPALLVVLAVVGVVAHWEVLPTARDELRTAGLATLGYVANWNAIFSGAGYWERTALPSWLEHTWSLAIEEQFYVVWPLVVILVLRRGGEVRRLRRLALGGALASGLAMVAWSWAGGDQQRLYLGTDTRAAALLLGCWAACRQQLAPVEDGTSERRALGWASIGSVAVLAAAWILLDGTSDLLYRGGLLACGVAATVVILDVTSPGPSVVGRVFSVAPLRALGAISYGLYLWHWPVFQFLYTGRYGLEGIRMDAVRVVVSVLFALASYVLVEQPIRRGRARSAAPVLLPLGVGLCVVALVAGTAGGLDIAPSSGRGTSTAAGPAGAPRLLVVGDSVAFSLAEKGLVPGARRLGLSVSDRSTIGCTLMRAVDDPFNDQIRNCSPSWPGDVASVRPDVVLVLLGGFVGVLPATIDGVETWPCEAAWDRQWRAQLEDAVDVLSADGATVVLATAPRAGLRILKGDDAELFDARQDCSNAVVREVAGSRPEAELYDLAHVVCPASGCIDELDGVELRVDGLHFGDGGAREIARRIAPFLVRAGA
ncbi:acyltransferase family protein [soil metagenome]